MGEPVGQGGKWGACRSPQGGINQLFPSTFEIHTVITGDGVTVTACGNHWGALPHITQASGPYLPVEGPGWAPQAPAPHPRRQEQPPSGVTTSLREMSPLSPEDGTAPFRPAPPARAL